MSDEEKFVDFVVPWLTAKSNEIKQAIVSKNMSLNAFLEALSKYHKYYKAWESYSFNNNLTCSMIGKPEWWGSSKKLRDVLVLLGVQQYVNPLYTTSINSVKELDVLVQNVNGLSIDASLENKYNNTNSQPFTAGSHIVVPKKRSDLNLEALKIIKRLLKLQEMGLTEYAESKGVDANVAEKAFTDLLEALRLAITNKQTSEQLLILAQFLKILANFRTIKKENVALVANDIIEAIENYTNIMNNTV
jgi:hypothetical protein